MLPSSIAEIHSHGLQETLIYLMAPRVISPYLLDKRAYVMKKLEHGVRCGDVLPLFLIALELSRGRKVYGIFIHTTSCWATD